MRTLLSLILFAALGAAQYPPSSGTTFGAVRPRGDSLPSSCGLGQLFERTGTTNPGLYRCSGTDTWVLVGPTWQKANLTFRKSTLTTCTSANPIICTMTAHGLPTGASTVWGAGGTGDWAALNGLKTVTYVDSTHYSFAIDGSAFAAFSGQTITTSTWLVTGLQGVAPTDTLTQDVVLLGLPANSQVTDWRIKSLVACTGATTIKTGLGTTGNNVLYRALTYDLKATVSATNLTTGPTAAAGMDTTAATNIVASIITTGTNIITIADGCSADFWVLYQILP